MLFLNSLIFKISSTKFVPRASNNTVQQDLSSKGFDMSNVLAGLSPKGQAVLRTSSGKK